MLTTLVHEATSRLSLNSESTVNAGKGASGFHRKVRPTKSIFAGLLIFLVAFSVISAGVYYKETGKVGFITIGTTLANTIDQIYLVRMQVAFPNGSVSSIVLTPSNSSVTVPNGTVIRNIAFEINVSFTYVPESASSPYSYVEAYFSVTGPNVNYSYTTPPLGWGKYSTYWNILSMAYPYASLNQEGSYVIVLSMRTK